MAFTRDDLVHTARLARLKLTDAELERFRDDLERITAYVRKLEEAAVADRDFAPVLPLHKSSQALREDVPHPWFAPGEAVAGAPDSKDGLFRVPKVIG